MNRRARLLLGCSFVLLAALAAGTAWALWERSVRDDRRPVLVGNRLVSLRTGAVLRTFDEDWWGALPDKNRPGVFSLDRLTIDTETNSVTETPGAHGPWITLTDGNAIACVDSSERALWRTALPDAPSSFGPDYQLLEVGSLVLVGSIDHLRALDRWNGHELWRSPGGGRYPCVSGDVVLASTGKTLVARSLATGTEVFRCDEPGTVTGIEAIDGKFVVTGMFPPSFTRVHDRQGALLLDLPVDAAYVDSTPEGLFVVSSKGFAHYRFPAGLVWRSVEPTVAGRSEWVGLVHLEGGGVIALSGSHGELDLIRLDAQGKGLWRTRCEPAEVEGGNGYSHGVYTEVRGDHLVVVNQSSVASYIEVLGLATGKKRRRFTYPPR